VDVSRVDTTTTFLGEKLAHPITLAPVGFQGVFHPEAELASARGAASAHALMIASTLSSEAIGEIAAARREPVWFQLYPTTDRRITRGLLERAEAAGCRVLVLTVDTPVMGNREAHGDWLARMLAGGARAANLEGLRVDEPILDPTMTWDMISWLRDHGSMKIVIKGIVTGEDAEICRQRGVDGIVVSNHGGRQEESGRGTLECLPEVLSGAGSELPVMIDGGIRRGTDVFKALALGAKAVAVGRPYVYGLAAMGSAGVELALEILRGELVRAMQLAGATSLGGLEPKFVSERGPQVTHEEIGGA
jgi:isopentenyl diphosphate isomerase/L-lactate dehydrogenase-like FMN-dependent dehydrogenase